MPNIKKVAIDAVIKRLQDEKEKINWSIQNNKCEFKRLTEKQTSLKRQRVILQELIRGLTPNKKEVKI